MNCMKPLTLKLIRKVLKRVEKALDRQRFRCHQDPILVTVNEYTVIITQRDEQHYTTITLPIDKYMKIRDTIKSYSRKYEKGREFPPTHNS